MKAILVLEMPSSCSECNLQQYGICHAVRKSIVGTPADLKSKPDWCPLKPAPEKRHTLDNFWEMCANIVRNACIDEILGDKE